MKYFSITELEQYTGIKAHTIRVWEGRYGIISPQRSQSKVRYYSLKELEYVLQLALLTKNGFKISRLSRLTAAQVLEKVNALTDESDLQFLALNEMILAMWSMKTESFESIMDRCFLNWPGEKVMRNIVHPFIEKTGLIQSGRGLAEEHLVVTVLRKKILSAIEKTKNAAVTTCMVLLFLPDTKQLDFGLLCIYFYLKHCGMKVVYMGNDVSIVSLKKLFEKLQPHLIYTYLPGKHKFPVIEMSAYLEKQMPHTKFVYTSSVKTDVGVAKNVVHLNFDEASRFLCRL